MYEVRPKWKGLSAYFEATTMWARESAGKSVVDDLSFEYPDRIRTSHLRYRARSCACACRCVCICVRDRAKNGTETEKIENQSEFEGVEKDAPRW